MAKTTLPLLSIEARGQLGKSIVYFPWKGINAVRTYVIPANPETPAQEAQRTKLENAVNEWHAAGYTTGDKTAWTLYASTLAKIMSGFNAMIKTHIDKAVAGKTWQRLFAGSLVVGSGGAGKFKATVDSDDEATQVVLNWGYSPTFMPNTDNLTFAAGVWSKDNIAAISGAWVYGYFTQQPANEYGRTGIYSYKVT